MGSHCLFRHLKHKLWPKEGPGVKLRVWLPTRKSQESTQFTWLQMTCDISLKSSWQELQLCFRPHLYPSSACKVMGLQSRGSPSSHDFGTPTRESQLARFWDSHTGVPGKKSHLDVGPVERCRVYYKGEGGGFPQVRAVVSLVCPCCPWFVLAPKVLQLCTNHFVWVVCRPVWVSEAYQLFLVPSRSSNTPFYPVKVLWARERALIPPPSAVFHLDSHLSPSRSWDCVNLGIYMLVHYCFKLLIKLLQGLKPTHFVSPNHIVK
jgi:hypothetical protein